MRLISFDCNLNQTQEDTRKESIELFNKSKRSIRIIAGNLDNPFYTNAEVRTALADAAKRGVCVEIAGFLPKATGGKATIKPLKIPEVKVWTLRQPAIRHMMSIDGKHARIEQKHRPGAKMTPAIICKNASFLAQDIDSQFERLVESK